MRFLKSQPYILHLPFLLLLLCFIVLKLPVLKIPFFWDELRVYAYPAFRLSQTNILQVLPWYREQADLFYGHPPLFALLLSFLFSVFGISALAARVFVLTIFCIGIVYFYRLLVHFTSSAWAFLATLMLLCFAGNFSYSTIIMSDVFLASLIPIYFHSIFLQHRKTAVLVGISMALSKETSLAILLAPMMAMLLLEPLLKWRQKIGYLFVPLLVLAVYFAIEKWGTGSFSNWPFKKAISAPWTSTEQLQQKYLYFIYFCSELRVFYFFIPSLLAFVFIFNKKMPMPQRTLCLTSLLAILFWILGHSIVLAYPFNYLLPFFPLVLLAIFPALTHSKWSGMLLLGIIIFVCIDQMEKLRSPVNAHRGDIQISNMKFVGLVALHQEAVKWVEENYSKEKIQAVWPLRETMRFGWAGWVKAPLIVVPLGQPFSIMVVAQQSDVEGLTLQEYYLGTHPHRLLKSFSNQNGDVSIYSFNSQ